MPESQVPLYPQLVPPTRDATTAQRLASIDRQLAGLNRNAGFINAGALGASYKDLVLGIASCAAYWRLNETSGATATDAKAGNSGTYAGGYTQGQPGGIADGSYGVLLDGVNGRVTTTYNPFTSGSKRTFTGWAIRTTNTTTDTLFGGDGGSPPLLRAGAGGDSIAFYANASAGSATWNSVVPLNAWFHWALTFDDTTRATTLYINGVSQGALTTPNSYTTTGNFEIGAWTGTADPWGGTLDDVAVFTEILSAEQIAALYNAGLRRVNPIGTGAITTSELAAGTITAQDIATGTLTANLMSVTSLSAIAADLGTIVAGTVTGATFQTSTVTPGPKVVMDSSGIYAKDASGTTLFKADASTGKIITLAGIGGGNELRNSSFEDSTLPGQSLVNATLASSTAQYKHGTRSALLTSVAAGAAQFFDSASQARRFPVVPGDKITLSAWVYGVDAQRNVNLLQAHYNSGGTFIGGSIQSTPLQSVPVGVWTRVSGTVTVPATAAWAAWGIQFDASAGSQRWYIDAAQVERGELVTAYAPKPDEVLPGTITGSAGGGTGEIQTGTVGGGASGTGNDIAAGAIAYDRINVTNLAAINANLGNIVSGTITGATIQTSSSTSTQRIVLDTSELSVRDTSNNSQVRLTASTGLLLRSESATTGSREINWWRPSDGSYAATVAGSDAGSTGNWKPNYTLRTTPTGGGPSSAGILTQDDSFGGFSRYARIQAVQSSGTYYYVLADVNAGVATSTSRVIIDSAGNSNFLQLPWGAQTTAPHVRVTNSAALSIVSGGLGAVLTFDTERWDNPNNDQHSTATNTDRLVCVAAGIYDIGAAVAWASSATGYRSMWFLVTFAAGGSAIIAVDDVASVAGNNAPRQTINAHYRLAVGDYVQILVFQNSGGAINVAKSANYSPEAWMTWLAP